MEVDIRITSDGHLGTHEESRGIDMTESSQWYCMTKALDERPMLENTPEGPVSDEPIRT